MMLKKNTLFLDDCLHLKPVGRLYYVDNVEITAGSGTTVAADDIGGVLHQRVKVEFGTDGAAADVSGTNPLPVHLASFATIPVAVGTHSILNAGGSLTAYQGSAPWLVTMATIPVQTNVTGYALEVGGNLDSIVTTLNSIKSKTDNLDVTLGSRLASGATLPITGTVSALNAGGSLTAFQGSAPWLVTQATLPVIIDKTGLATSAKQDDIITAINGISAGSALATVTTIQGDPGTRAWLVTLATLPIVGTLTSQITITAIQGDAGTKPWLTTLSTLSAIVDTELPSAAALGDSDGNPTTPLVGASNMIYNGSSWARVRQVSQTLNASGTGYIGAGMVAQFDDVSPTSITENNFGQLRMSSRREAYTQIRDAAGNERGLNVNVDGSINVLATLATLSVITNLGKVEDLAHTSGDIGVMMLGVRNDSPSNFTNTDGDYTPFRVSANGDVSMRMVGSYPTFGDGRTNAPTIMQSSEGNDITQPSYPFGYNGSTWDRFRVGAVNNASSATGFTDSLAIGQYRPTLLSLSDQAFNTMKIDLFGNAMVNTNVALPNSTRFNRFLTFASMASIMAAPGTGKRLVVREMDFSGNATLSVKLVEDHAGTPVTVWGPHYFLPYAGFIKPTCYIPITANKSLGIDITGSAFNSTLDIRIETENV